MATKSNDSHHVPDLRLRGGRCVSARVGCLMGRLLGHRRLFGLGLGLGLGTLLTATALAQAQPLDAIVAVVNDDVIVQSEIDAQISQVLPELAARGTAAPARAILERQVLDRLILDRLQTQRAQQLGIEVDEATLTQAVTSIAARNGLSLEELRDALLASGISYEAFRDETRDDIITARLQQEEVIKNIRVSDQEIDRFLATEADSLLRRTEVRLGHILIALPDNPSEAQVNAARSRIEQLLRRARSGEDFAALAVANSAGGRALEGGDLGWFPLAEVPSLAVEPATQLRKGEISEPLRSPSGFHLIRLTDIKGDAPEPMAQTHARHILIRTSEVVSDQDARTRLEQLRLRISGGDDFSTLARSHSDDTGSALKGGDLGWINPGDTVPAFEEAMDALAPGAIGQPFQSPFGWHLVQVLERRNQDTTDELLRRKAEQVLKQRKAEDATELWLRQLRAQAYVELRQDDDTL